MECYEARKKKTRNSINVDSEWLSRDIVLTKSVVNNMLPLDNRRTLVGAHDISENIQRTVVASVGLECGFGERSTLLHTFLCYLKFFIIMCMYYFLQ